MAKSGWFNESRRHSLAAKGFSTSGKPILPSTLPTPPFDPYRFQDTHQEEIIHSPDWEGANFRFVLEGAGDVFRELTHPIPHNTYIEEKLRRIEEHIKDEKSGEIHKDDGLSRAQKEDALLLQKLEWEWAKQPARGDAQLAAKMLNLELIKGDWVQAKLSIAVIREHMRNKDGVK